MKNIYQFKITLKRSKPTIYRSLLVEDDRSFFELHHIIQIAMGWSNYHLFEFETGAKSIADPSMIDDDEVLDAKEIKLYEVFTEEGKEMEYEYDFGDGWIHTIKLEKILPVKLNESYPVCKGGERSGPPEDCGGIWGYERLLEVMSDKKDPEYKEMKEWLGGDFDPERFDREGINENLRDLENIIEDSTFEI